MRNRAKKAMNPISKYRCSISRSVEMVSRLMVSIRTPMAIMSKAERARQERT